MPRSLAGVLIRCLDPPENYLRGVANGGLKIGNDLFDKFYLVRAEDPFLAYELLNPANVSLLLDFNPLSAARRGGPKVSNLTYSPAVGFHLWTAGRWLLALTPMSTNGKGLERAFETMSAFLDNVPAAVWK